MKAVGLGIAAMVVISAISWVVLETQITTADEAYTSQNNSVRLD